MERILRIKEVKNTVGLSIPTIYRLIREDKFPRQFNIGENSTGWLASDIQKWIKERVKASGASI